MCLGVLQTAEANMQDVRDKIMAEGYETNGDMTLTLKVSLSAAILVRQALVVGVIVNGFRMDSQIQIQE